MKERDVWVGGDKIGEMGDKGLVVIETGKRRVIEDRRME